MVLRFTMAEFRKIQSNDKILFGVLIAVIIFNSMIPRVIEGNTRQYYGPNSKIWKDSECPNIGVQNSTLEQCKETCDKTQGCTAINYGTTSKNCILRKCPPEGKEPSWSLTSYQGYSVYPTTYNPSLDKGIYNVITPKITTSTTGNVPTVGDGVMSISGSFRTSVAITTGMLIIFEFPTGYFAKPAADTPDADVVPVKLKIVQRSGATSTPVITDLNSTSTFGALTGSTPKLMFTIGNNAILANIPTSSDYEFTISSTSDGSEMFKLGPDQVQQTQSGFKISASTATATTSDIATAGSAVMPTLYKQTTNAATSSASGMSARQQGIINNIARIQAIEKQLLNKLNDAMDAEQRSEIVAQINDLAKARGDLYNNMNDFSSQLEMVASERRNALVQNSVAVNVIRNQIANSSNTLDGLQQEKSNKMRLVEINNYYGKKYEFQTDIMKIIILTCVPVLVISILLKKGFIPNLIATGLIILIVAAGVITVARKVMDLNRRNNFNFDQYDHPFNPYAVSVTKKETTNLADINKLENPFLCIGPACCTDTSTVWDDDTKKCIKSTGVPAASDALNVPAAIPQVFN